MAATYRNNDWTLNRNNAWYKVRPVLTVKFLLIVAGWEPRAISLLLGLGIHFHSLRLDHRNPTGLAGEIENLGIQNVPAAPYMFEGHERNYYTDLMVKITGRRTDDGIAWDEEFQSYISFFNLEGVLESFVDDQDSNVSGLGVNSGDDNNNDDNGSEVEITLFNEVKCMGGSVKRNGIEQCLAKWTGVVNSGKPLITLFFGETSLIVAWMNKPGKNTSTMKILKSIYWTKPTENGNDVLALDRVKKYHKQCTVRRNENDHILPENTFSPQFHERDWRWEFLNVDKGVKLHEGDFDGNFQTLCPSGQENKGWAMRGFDGWTTYDNKSLSRDDISQMLEDMEGMDTEDLEIIPDIDDDDDEANGEIY